MLRTHIPPKQPDVLPFPDEHVMVVARADMFKNGLWQGLKTAGVDNDIHMIRSCHTFTPRADAETDLAYKQIIPYLVFTHAGRYFLMQRHAQASETRLCNKMSLGIGGHIRSGDIRGCDFFGWAEREFHEEVDYAGSLSSMFLGLLNDDSNDVGKVHLGIVLLVTGDSSPITIKSELKSGCLLSLDECWQHYNNLEPWSQLVLIELRKSA